MNTVRMFVFAIAFLSAAFLLRQIVDVFSSEEPIHAADAAHRAVASADPQQAAVEGSP
jgi:hypothetical protein